MVKTFTHSTFLYIYTPPVCFCPFVMDSCFILFHFISFHFISFHFILLYNHCVCNSGAYMLTCAVVIIILPLLYRAFCDKFNKARVDHLFSLLFEKALATPPGANEKDCVNKLTDLLPGVQWLNLPLTMEVNII